MTARHDLATPSRPLEPPPVRAIDLIDAAIFRQAQAGREYSSNELERRDRMLKYFYKGALHGLIIGLLGCAVIATGMYRWLPTQAGQSGPSRTGADGSAHRRAQRVLPMAGMTVGQ